MKRVLAASLAFFMVVSLLPVSSVQASNERLLNLALNKPATESSVYPGTQRTAQKAVDGIGNEDTESRWSTKRLGTGTPAEQYDPNMEQWMMVDMGEEYTVNQVNIDWEGAFAKKYVIQGSLDGETFENVVETGVTSAGMKEHTGLEFNARYVRILCQEPKNASWGYSIYELEVYSDDVIDETYEVTAAEIIAEVENVAPVLAEDGQSLVLPEVPEGYEISLYGTDNAQVISKDNVVYQPIVDMPVKVMYQVVNTEDAEDKAASSADAPTIIIPGKYEIDGDNEKPNVVPGLREWDGAEGTFELTEESRIVYTEESQKAAAQILKTYIKDMLEMDTPVVSGEANAGDIAFETAYTTEELGSEGYYMNIDDVVTILAPADTKSGWLYGAASITQILYQSDDFTAPKGLTRDYPQYEVRAGMIDVGRMYIPLEYLEEMTIYMSFYKMNEAHIHINDYWGQSGYSAFRLESEVFPSITAKDGYYTKAEYKQYQKDMKAYGVDVITEIDAPYHADAFKDVEGVVMWKAGYLDIRTEDAYNANREFMEQLIDEYLDGEDPVIQSKNFHIGTDEYDKTYGEQMRKWTDHFAKYVNAKGYQSRAWASLGKNGFKGTTPVTNEIVMNLWAPYWADVHETYNAGYDVINTYGGWLYIVPAANAGYPDRYDTKRLYEKFEVNDFKSGRNPSGEAIMPVAHPQTKGASFALWNDMTSFRTGFSWFDIYDRIKDAVSLVSEKTWYGEDDNGQTYEEFRERIDALQNKVPNANPGRFVESDTDVIADYEFNEDGTAVIDGTTNGYDAVLTGAEAKDGAVAFDGNGYLSLPMNSIGYPYTVLMNATIDGLAEEATLFAGADGTFYVNKLGKLSYARDQYEFTFNYTPKTGEEMAIALTCDAKNLTLYVNGKMIGTGKLTNETIAGKTQQSSTFILPVERVFEHTKGTLKEMSIYNRVLSAEEIYKELGIARENLALNKEVSVSGLEVNDGRFTADKAVDGIVTKESRVSFAKDQDEQWLLVDLGDVNTISEVVINYESAVGKYEIQVSEDGENFETVYVKNEATTNGPEVIETITIDPVDARYVKYVQKERWKHSGNGKWYSGSIYEFEVYAPIVTVPKPSKNALVAKGPNSSGSLSASRQIGPSTTNYVDVEFDMYTSIEPTQTNTAVGLGSTDSNYTAYGQVPVIVRMFSDGCFGAYNGKTGGYVQSKVAFTQNEKYHVRVNVNLEDKTYSAYATGPDGVEQCFAKNYGYRAAAPSEIGKIYLFNNERPEGSYWLERISVKEADVDTSVVYDRIAELEEFLTASINTEAKMDALQAALAEVRAKADDYTLREENLAALDTAYEAFMAKEEGKVRIGSFNIAANKKPDVDKMREQLEKYDVDIAGIQEVDKNTQRNPYDMLAAFQGDVYQNIFYSRAIDFQGGQYGIGTVSKAELRDGTTTMLESAGNEQRVFQRNVVELGGCEVAFYNTHLSYESMELRHEQMNTVKAAMDADPVEYKIIVGDFNADQYHEEFEEIFGADYNIANGMNGIFQDTFNGVDDTMEVNCVDNIITSKNIEIEVVQMVANKLSDHNMFFADVTFKTEPVKTDKEDLKALIAYAKEAQEADNYEYLVPTVRALFEEALAEAEAVDADIYADQETVDAAYELLLSRVHLLDFTGNPGRLEVLVDLAGKEVEAEYTKESWAPFAAALAEANKLLEDADALQAELDAAYTALDTAMKALEKIPVDKTKLAKLVQEANAYEANISNYVESTTQEFLAALVDARAVLDNDKAIQAEVESAYKALLKGIFGLREVPNKDKLKELLGQVEAMDLSAYSAKTAKAVRAAYAEAVAVAADKNADHTEVDAAAAALEEAIAAAKAEEKGSQSGSVSDNVSGEKTSGSDHKVVSDNGSKTNTTSKSASNTAAKTGDDANAAIPAAAGLAAILAALLAWKKRA